jgi:hypothetical protein
MALLKAAQLGIERFAGSRNKESWAHASVDERNTIIRAAYQQVLGNQYVMASERLEGLESLFRNGDLSVREFVRQLAKSALYKSRFFENCNPYRFIELNFKHLLGRAPQNKEEMLHHFTILQEQGYDFNKIPLVIQYNKRDLPNVRSDEEIAEIRSKSKEPVYTAIAIRGDGVIETLFALLRLTFRNLNRQYDFEGKFDLGEAEFLRAIFKRVNPEHAANLRERMSIASSSEGWPPSTEGGGEG